MPARRRSRWPRTTSIAVPRAGKFLYRFVPIRRQVILDNLRRVYGEYVGDDEIVRLAQAHYGHLWRLFCEFLRFRWLSHERKMALVRIENVEAFADALGQNKGVLILTGHFGNWEVSTIAGLNHYPQMRGRFHFVRRAIKPAWLDALVTRRFNEAGFGVFPKRGSLDAMLERLGQGDAIVFPFDQHARPPDGIEVDFFGHPAWTFKSLAIIALATGAPVLPASSWREADGKHVLRFEDPMAPIECENTGEAIRRNTRAYNAALERVILRRPEQWYWVHRRWKAVAARPRQTQCRNMTSMLASLLSWKAAILYLFIASAMFVHFRGRVRLKFYRQVTDHSTFMAPYNALHVLVLRGAQPAVHRDRPLSRVEAADRQLADAAATRRCSSSTRATSARPPATTIWASTRSSGAAGSASTSSGTTRRCRRRRRCARRRWRWSSRSR